MLNRKAILPYSIDISLVTFSILVIQTPLLIIFRLTGIISASRSHDWVICILVLGLILTGYALKNNLICETDELIVPL